MNRIVLVRRGGDVEVREPAAMVLVPADDLPALVAESGQDWDTVLLIRYPTRQAFSRMVADPEYQQVTALRTRALTEAVLQATVPW